MVETRAWKANRGLPVESEKCRICRQAKQTVTHWLSEYTRIAATEYLKRHNNDANYTTTMDKNNKKIFSCPKNI